MHNHKTDIDDDDLGPDLELGDRLLLVAGWCDALPAEHRAAATFHVDRLAVAIAVLAAGHTSDPLVATLVALRAEQ
jgi:hypothetical protein